MNILPKENFYNRPESPDKLTANGMDTPTELEQKEGFHDIVDEIIKAWNETNI